MRFKSPSGSPIVGTYERLTARANATEYSATGEPDYAGDTEVFWDEQKTVMRDGSMIYLDEDGMEWIFTDLIPDTDEEEE